MRRRLFVGFGLAILASAALAWAIHALLVPASAAAPLALAGAALVLWSAAGAIAWIVTRPLSELVLVARDLGEGKLDRRMGLRGMGPHQHRHDEVAILAHAVNTMAERIEAQIAGQRELLAGVSHELRTPLGHLRVLIDTAREQGGGGEALLTELEREIVELDGLVDQLLAHSRLEFDRVEGLVLDPVALAVRALERVGADASKLEIESAVETVVGDPTLLGRALANLLSNAKSHGRGLTALRIQDGDAEGGEGQREGEGRTLCFTVEDRGPGFADGEAERVFESFVQGQDHCGGSLGLGLSLVRRIAEAHGGRAWAHNREGGGASVGFCVPLGRRSITTGG